VAVTSSVEAERLVEADVVVESLAEVGLERARGLVERR
jgi:hypothetical protein